MLLMLIKKDEGNGLGVAYVEYCTLYRFPLSVVSMFSRGGGGGMEQTPMYMGEHLYSRTIMHKYSSPDEIL